MKNFTKNHWQLPRDVLEGWFPCNLCNFFVQYLVWKFPVNAVTANFRLLKIRGNQLFPENFVTKRLDKETCILHEAMRCQSSKFVTKVQQNSYLVEQLCFSQLIAPIFNAVFVELLDDISVTSSMCNVFTVKEHSQSFT